VRAVPRGAAIPALATIKLGEEKQEAIVPGIQVPGQLDDLIFELVRRANVGGALFESGQ
jgi:hypothetical protein